MVQEQMGCVPYLWSLCAESVAFLAVSRSALQWLAIPVLVFGLVPELPARASQDAETYELQGKVVRHQ
jgi:hypothetical protein